MHARAKSLIESLDLKAHREGGYFSEYYRSELQVSGSALGNRYAGVRSAATAVYFLVTSESFSTFHRIASDEIWHFYEGDPMEVLTIAHTTGELAVQRLGEPSALGFTLVVPAHTWMAGYPVGKQGYSLFGCTVSPGFEYEDFELAERAELLKKYPQHAEVVNKFSSR